MRALLIDAQLAAQRASHIVASHYVISVSETYPVDVLVLMNANAWPGVTL